MGNFSPSLSTGLLLAEVVCLVDLSGSSAGSDEDNKRILVLDYMEPCGLQIVVNEALELIQQYRCHYRTHREMEMYGKLVVFEGEHANAVKEQMSVCHALNE